MGVHMYFPKKPPKTSWQRVFPSYLFRREKMIAASLQTSAAQSTENMEIREVNFLLTRVQRTLACPSLGCLWEVWLV